MRVDDFDFDLPEDRIALRPAEPRGARAAAVDACLLVRADRGRLVARDEHVEGAPHDAAPAFVVCAALAPRALHDAGRVVAPQRDPQAVDREVQVAR